MNLHKTETKDQETVFKKDVHEEYSQFRPRESLSSLEVTWCIPPPYGGINYPPVFPFRSLSALLWKVSSGGDPTTSAGSLP